MRSPIIRFFGLTFWGGVQNYVGSLFIRICYFVDFLSSKFSVTENINKL